MPVVATGVTLASLARYRPHTVLVHHLHAVSFDRGLIRALHTRKIVIKKSMNTFCVPGAFDI